MAIGKLEKILGIGPIGAVISIFILLIAAWADHNFWHSKIMTNPIPLRAVSLIFAVTGLCLLLWSVRALRNWWSKEELCTTGPFKWFRHPVYAAWITFILPAVALFLNSWTIVFVVFLIHPIWHQLVKYEEKLLSEKFKDEYRSYQARTGRFFPRIMSPR